ncbi:hypothetical protein [Streptomyces sp. NRRL S-920]|nr:hypothetical protein [Streptomyces sp. NRRL S-920]
MDAQPGVGVPGEAAAAGEVHQEVAVGAERTGGVAEGEATGRGCAMAC